MCARERDGGKCSRGRVRKHSPERWRGKALSREKGRNSTLERAGEYLTERKREALRGMRYQDGKRGDVLSQGRGGCVLKGGGEGQWWGRALRGREKGSREGDGKS